VGSIKKDNNLSKRIESAIDKKDNKTKNYENLNVSLVNTFSRVATELLAGLLIGTSLGWLIDNWLNTSPLFLIIFFLLGGAAGILNLWRIITGKGLKIGYFN
jgi:ATP synthase protein I|tara:strand:+ start:1376 stop:1681 length:306 start_codon:yes stop_codon:yes gene_type:complete